MEDLLTYVWAKNYIDDGHSGGSASGGGGRLAVLLLILAVLGWVAWQLWKLYLWTVSLYLRVVSFTAENTGTILLVSGGLATIVALIARLLLGGTSLSHDDWKGARFVGAGAVIAAIVFRYGAHGYNIVYVEDAGTLYLIALVMGGIILIVTFLLMVVGLIITTGQAIAFSHSVPTAAVLGAPAVWGCLTWGWFVLFGEPGYLPFTNPIPGLNAVDAILLLPSAALFSWGVVGTMLHDAAEDTDRDNGSVASKKTGNSSVTADSSGPRTTLALPEELETLGEARELVKAMVTDPTVAAERLPTVRKLLESDDADLRRGAATALQRLANAEPAAAAIAVDDLVRALGSDDPVVVRTSLQALGNVADERPGEAAVATEQVAALLDHDRPSVRSEAIIAAAEVVDHDPRPFVEAVESVTALLNISDSEANRAAARVLRVVVEEEPAAIQPVTPQLEETLTTDLLHPEIESNLDSVLRNVGETPTESPS